MYKNISSNSQTSKKIIISQGIFHIIHFPNHGIIWARSCLHHQNSPLVHSSPASKKSTRTEMNWVKQTRHPRAARFSRWGTRIQDPRAHSWCGECVLGSSATSEILQQKPTCPCFKEAHVRKQGSFCATMIKNQECVYLQCNGDVREAPFGGEDCGARNWFAFVWIKEGAISGDGGRC